MLVYHHIPKTGGSYVIQALVESMRTSGKVPFKKYRIGFRHTDTHLDLHRNNVGIMCSHWSFKPERVGRLESVEPRVHSLHKEDIYFTWLRDPVDMFISAFEFYRFAFRKEGPTSNRLPTKTDLRFYYQVINILKARNFEEYIKSCSNPEIDCYPMGQLRKGDPRLKSFDFVGSSESMEKDLTILCEMLDIKAVIPQNKKNEGPKEISRDSWRPQIKKLLEEKIQT